MIAVARAPLDWTRGKDTLLVRYGVMYAYDWPTGAEVTAVQVLDRQSRVLGQWAEVGPHIREYWPVGRGFVGITPFRADAVLVQGGTVNPLTRVPGTHHADQGDERFGKGWLLNRNAMTVTRERIPGCRQDSIQTDVRGRRVWCLDGPKKHISWSDDGARTWQSHRLSESYFDYCDGGSLGGDLKIQGDVVAIGLWRADFSLDRGRSWHDVALPLGLIGARHATGGAEDDCTVSEVLPDGRLVVGHFRNAVATDATNSRFGLVRTPPGTSFVDVRDGVMVAASNKPLGERYVSYDGAATWLPARAASLLNHLTSPS